MKKSFIQTLALVAVFGGLLAWYLVVEKKIRPQQKEAEDKGKRLVHLDRDQIQEVVIERKNPSAKAEPFYSTIKLKKVGSDWMIAEPIEDATDGTMVSSMLSNLTTEKQDRVLEENPKDLVPFGLEKPTVKLTIRKDSASPPEELWIGDKTPVGNGAYVRLGNKGPVYRSTEAIRTSFDKELNAIRSKSVVSIPRFEVQEMEIQGPGGNVVLKKGAQESWRLLREDAPADTAEVNKSLNSLVDLKATEFVSDKASDAATYGLTNPQVKATLRKADDKGKQTVWISSSKGKTYAKREDKATIYQIDNEIAKTLSRKGSEYRDSTLAKFNRFDVSRVVLGRAQDPIELKKEGATWKLASDAAFEVDSAKVDTLLTTLQDAKIVKFLSEKEKLKTAAMLTVQLFEKHGDKEEQKVELALTPSDKGIIGTRKGVEGVFEISPLDWRKISVSKSAFAKPAKKAEPAKSETTAKPASPSKNG